MAAAALLAGVFCRASDTVPLSPTDLVSSPDGQVLYVACATAGQVLVMDADSRRVTRTVRGVDGSGSKRLVKPRPPSKFAE